MMGMIFKRDADGNHVSTGKYPYAGGLVHPPEWGPWIRDRVDFRRCLFDKDGCDLEDYRTDGRA
jgi:hypothetical protein